MVWSPRLPLVPRLTTTAGPSRPAAASCCTTGTIVFICRLTTASTRMPFSSSSSAAPSITESPMAKIGFAGGSSAAASVDGRRHGRRHGRRAPWWGVGTVVAACGTVLLVARPGAGTVVPVVVGAPVVVDVVSSRSSMFVTEPAPSSSDWAISFCLSWAVARLATANTETATTRRTDAGDDPARRRVAGRLQAAPPPPDVAPADRCLDEAERQLGDDQREHHGGDQLRDRQVASGHAAHHLVDRPVVQVQPVAADADPHEDRGCRSPRRPAPEPWVTAAMTATLARPMTKKPPRNSHGSAPSSVTMCSSTHITPRAARPSTATRSSRRPCGGSDRA